MDTEAPIHLLIPSSRTYGGVWVCLVCFALGVIGFPTAAAQSVTSLQPESGVPGTQVRIYGASFDPNPSGNTVAFGGVEATLDSAKSTVLYAQVPSGAEGPVGVTVTVGEEMATSPDRFVVVAGGSEAFDAIGAGLAGVELSSSDWGDFDDDGDLDLVVTGEEDSRDETTKIYENEGGGAFSPVGAGLTSVSSGSSEWGDYDGDSDLDLVVTGVDDGKKTAKIYENEGGGSFSAVGAGLTGVRSSSTAWGDFDSDGDLDLVVTGSDNNIERTATIYENKGGGSFSAVGAGLTSVRSSSTAWGDFDSDGDLDLVVTGEDDDGNPTARIYENEGNGNFSFLGAGLTNVDSGSSEWGDFDGDGDLDLVITGYDDITGTAKAKIYENEGTGDFSAVGASLIGVRNSSSDWGDFDGDGDLDLVVTGEDSTENLTARIYRNEGGGSFQAIEAGLAGVVNSSSAWGDYDGDGDLDLVATGYDGSTQTARVYGNGVDTNPPDPPADLSAQTHPDSVSLTWFSSDSADVDKYRTYRDTAPIDSSAGPSAYTALDSTAAGDTTFTDTSVTTGQTYYYRVTAVDTAGNESGFSEQASATPSHPLALTSLQPESGATGTQVRIYGSGFDPTPSNNTVTFGGVEATVDSAQSRVLYARVPSGAEGPVGVTVTVGGKMATSPDRFVGVTGGGERFADIGAELTGVQFGSSEWGDFDGDGDLDLVVIGADGSRETAKIYENEGGGSFSVVGADLTGVDQGSLDWGDYDGDGDLDLIITGYDGSSRTAKIYENESGGSFSAVGAALTGVTQGSSEWGDYDGEGDLDLVVTGNDGSDRTTKIYENEGGGNFSAVEAGLTGLDRGSSSEWGDFDGDGDLDLVVTGNDGTGGTAKIYENKGGGSFSTIGVGLVGVRTSSTAWGDFDGDSDLDLVITGDDGSSSTARIYENEGGSSFSAVGAGLTGVAGLTGGDHGSSEWGDFDGDGDLDLVITGYDGSRETAKIYENKGEGNFSVVGAGLTGVDTGSSSEWGDFDGDGDLDLVVTGNDESGNQTAKIYKNGENQPPTASSDSYATEEGRVLTVEAPGVLENDTDPEGDALSAVLVSGVASGTLSLDSDGSFEYAPNSGFTGTDQFEYEASDGETADTATATIEVKTLDAPSSLKAAAKTDRVRLQWSSSSSLNVVGHEVFRAQSTFSDPSQATLVTGDPVTDTTYVDDSSDLEPGTQYHYRVRPVSNTGTDGPLSEEVSVTLPPAEVQAQTSMSFGPPGEADSYRLVALPGASGQDLSNVVPGTSGPDADYRAFREEGGSGGQDYAFNECGAEASCTFGPGTGFWLLHREDWSHDQSYPTVDLSQAGTYEVDLTPGWNLISNPFATDLSWSAVTAANQDALDSGESLGPIYRLSGGTWSTPGTLASAQSGEAFYFNNAPNLESLVLPHPTARDATAQPSTSKGTPQASMPARSTVLRAFVEGELESRVEVGLAPGATPRLDARDAEAPPSPFEPITLRSVVETSEGSTRLLRDYRPPEQSHQESDGASTEAAGSGARFPLRLWGLEGHQVSIRAANPRQIETEKLVLVKRPSGRVHDLRKKEAAALRPDGPSQPLVLLAGSASYVDAQKKDLAPGETRLFANYPNPAKGETTIEFALPEATEVRLSVYDVLGRRVATLVRGRRSAGFHQVRWDDPSDLASGSYFYRLRAGDATQTRKLTILR